MSATNMKQKIQSALQSFSKDNLTENALNLFKTLGYNTERQSPLNKPTFAAFKASFIDNQSTFNEEKAKVGDWKYVDLLFQLSKEEILKQMSLFDTKQVDRTIIETYLFFTIELANEHYSRTALSHITREVNRLFPMPVMILFKHGSLLTLSVINRRLHKRDDSKDVLEKVTLIKDIRISPTGGGVSRTGMEIPLNKGGEGVVTHRAHIEILFDLSFDELKNERGFTNFVELHNAWQKALDASELNKRFFRELANWYFWAMDNVEFPDDLEKKTDVRNATNLIRLITRLVFIWFIKEKDLLPDLLFRKNYLNTILNGFNKDNSSNVYYHAILQNLFFGTLNQKMGERGFAKEGSFPENKNEYGVKNLFRYADKFSIKEEEVVELFKDIPFLNGGLFDCLDKPNDEGKVVYGDGFSRNPQKQANVPDFLFFSDELEADLNEIFGTKNKKYKVKGLINLLDSYKFTVAENTPIEEEIALDPELLGKVFENLLASYNPETQTTARKQTGSFYTPREIVNYMVDESLLAYLKQKLEETGTGDSETRLRDLLSYSENPNPFNEKETQALIAAIDTGKILDPACGSGAFPMGILHKLVHILHKLDPRNELWKQKQIDKASQIDDPNVREHAIQDIEEAFENNELDYGRKLYLIENCIYGVDIQPIAVQIAKLRFFISLIIDEKKQPGRENLGIRSLPNLETKFVAANTLIGIEKPLQRPFKTPELGKLEKDLKQLRHQYFSAKTRKEKLYCQKQDTELRQCISKRLMTDGWGVSTAKQMVQFDPYDQNTSSPFFDPEWMFGIKGGFDVVIGNPPYMIIQTLTESCHKLIRYYKDNYKSATGKFDIYCLFTEKGLSLINPAGILNFIMPSKWIISGFGSGLRTIISQNQSLYKFISFNSFQVFNASTYTSLLWLTRIKNSFATTVKLNKDIIDSCDLYDWLQNHTYVNSVVVDNSELTNGPWSFSNEKTTNVLKKITTYKEISRYLEGVFQGIVTGDNDIFWLNDSLIQGDLITGFSKALNQKVTIERSITFPFLNGRTIGRYKCKFNNTYIIYPYKLVESKTEIIDETQLLHQYPLTHAYFLKLKDRLINRGSETMKYPLWYSLWNQRTFERLQKKGKILTPDVSYKGSMWKDSEGRYFYADTSYAIIVKKNFLQYCDVIYSILNSSMLWFYLQNTGAVQRGGFFRFKTNYLKPFPVPEIDFYYAVFFSKIVPFVSFLSEHNNDNRKIIHVFEALLDAMVYELYLPEEIKTAGCEISKHLTDLPEFKDDWSDEKKLAVIEKVYKELSDSKHPVSVAMEKMQEIPEVKLIEGKE